MGMENTDNKDKNLPHLYESDSEDARIWMEKFIKGVRNCTYYYEEYKECNSMRGKLYNRFTYGEKLDCNHWFKAYQMCEKVKKYNDAEALNYVVEHEIVRREFRLRSARENDVWEYRFSPPEDWATVAAKKSVNTDDENNREIHVGRSDKDKSDPKISGKIKDKSDTETKPKLSDKNENSKKDEETLIGEIFASKPKVNPKYDNSVQRCVIL